MDNKKREVVFQGNVIGSIEITDNQSLNLKRANQLAKDLNLIKEIDKKERMIRHAMSFWDITETMRNNNFSSLPNNPYNLAPFVVNATFCVEILLKSILSKYGITKRIHEIKNLYQALPKSAKEKINKKRFLLREKYPIDNKKNFTNYLDSLNKAFENWRYLYESKMQYIEILSIQIVVETLFLTTIDVNNLTHLYKANTIK